ncbi:AMP-binding protein [Nonomuraea soli]|uniref:Acyl-CoA synthetase (AMP-forming)/AMP-acid ligase II n=1 Tax=Nonomuraea soli TaxID=1032476 RepID=A0A7W0CTT9_9ACTN|nr:AMP-binding protein [Nonomuraea soli]MBA2897201.1 acyl-CoA synthetase (AMP-forming)/AMP-acid ligase II [Nonomuraea soli]
MSVDLVAEVLASCARTPRATAIIDAKGREVTFGALRERSLRVRDTLVSAGLRPGEGVLYAVRPSPEAIAVALGVVGAGGTLILADPGLAPGVLEARLRVASPGWVVAESLLYLVTSARPLRGLVRRRGVLLPALGRAAARHAYTGPWLPGVPGRAIRLDGGHAGSLRPGAGDGGTGSGGPGAGGPGPGVAGWGAAGSGAAGSGAAGSGVAGPRGMGSGTPGSSAAGSGVAGSSAAGSSAAGSGVAGSSAAGAGVAGAGVAGSGVAGAGVGGGGPGGIPGAGGGPGGDRLAGGGASEVRGAELESPAAVIFTSGTTAHPRGVVHTRASLAAGLEIFRARFPLQPGDVVHTDGLMLGLPALIGGATWSMPGATMQGREITHLYQVPVEAARLESVPPSVRHLLLGSAPAPPAVLKKCMAMTNGQVHSIYAMTEALPISVASAEEKLDYPQGDLLGPPLPGVGVRVTEEQELIVSGPHIARGYLGEAPLTEVPTGDLVRLDADGNIVLLGRKKDMLLRDGFNIYPSLYEPSIAALPGVREAAIVGLADPETGDEEVVLALVAGEGFQEGAVRRRLPDLMDAGALPDRIVVLPELPVSGRSQKLDRAALREIVN